MISKIDNMTYKIDKLFGSKTRVKILSELVLNPKRRYYIRELSRRLNIPYSVLYKEIKNLVEVGIIKLEKKGKISLISLNENLPYLQELKMILIKTAALGGFLKASLEKFKGIKYALIYGSFVSGKITERSDIDLLIIGSLNEGELAMEMSEIERKVGREVNYMIWSEREFLRRVKKKHHILVEIARNPLIMLIGDENEFRRAVEQGIDL